MTRKEISMPKYKSIGARPLGLAVVGALAVGFVSTGPTLAASASPAAASTEAGSAFVANSTLIVTGTNGPDVITLGADATTAQVAFGNDPADVQRFDLTSFKNIAVSLGNGDDQFTEGSAVLSDKALTVDGGNGNDIITA